MLRVLTSSKGHEYTYRDDTVIGSGYYACVYKAFDWKNKRYVAIKVVNNTPIKPKRRGSVSGPDKELIILKDLANTENNVVQLLDVIKDRDYVYMVTELCEGGTLKELLGYSKIGRLDESDAVRYLYDMVKGVVNMHEKGIMHRDLNLENIFLKGGRCVIGDLGSATMNEISETMSGTPEYRAPEIFKAKEGRTYNKQVDVWSLGIIFHEMLFGKKPYEGDLEQIPKIIERNLYKVPADIAVSEDTIELLTRMIEVNPQKRISIEEAIIHSIFETYNEANEEEIPKHTVFEIKSTHNGIVTTKEGKRNPRKFKMFIEAFVVLVIGFLICVHIIHNPV